MAAAAIGGLICNFLSKGLTIHKKWFCCIKSEEDLFVIKPPLGGTFYISSSVG